MGGIVRTFYVQDVQNALLNREVDGINQRQNHKYQSFLELHPDLLEVISPFHRRPILPKVVLVHVIYFQIDGLFPLFGEQEPIANF